MKKVLAVLAALVVGLVMVAPVASASQNNDDKGGKNNCRQDNGHNDRSFNDDKGGKDDCKDDDGKDKPKPPKPPVVPPVVTPVVVAPVFSGPKPIIQAYGIAEDPTCALTPAWAKFSNVADGGWGKSWGPWLNGGKGGEACVRYIVYKKDKGTWVPSGSL